MAIKRDTSKPNQQRTTSRSDVRPAAKKPDARTLVFSTGDIRSIEVQLQEIKQKKTVGNPPPPPPIWKITIKLKGS